MKGYGVFNNDGDMLAWFPGEFTAKEFAVKYVHSTTGIKPVDIDIEVPTNNTSEVNSILEEGHTIYSEENLPTRDAWLKMNPLRRFMAETHANYVAIANATGIKICKLISMSLGLDEPQFSDYIKLHDIMGRSVSELQRNWGAWFELTPDNI